MRRLTVLLLVCGGAIAQSDLPPAYLQNPVIRQGQYVLWHDPGDVAGLDFRYGIGGSEMAPQPPFRFEDEDTSGTTPKITVTDARNRHWAVKFGSEASPETFCTRLAWALGYYVEPNYFVSDGVVEGAHNLHRARAAIDSNGRFHAARFQLRSRDPRYLRYVDWSWSDNPFLGTPELNGLKILIMLVSNWDDKDARDTEKRGSNTAIYQHGELLYYFIDDWGGAMGNWGKYFTRSKWDAQSFLHQSSNFVSIKDGNIQWGYVGQHSSLMTRDLKYSDISWLLRSLRRISDEQLTAGLLSSGATPEESRDYVQGFRMRIQALEAVTAPTTAQ